MKKKKTSSILRKFLLFNLSIFSVLGLFTILYLNAIQPNLVKKVSASHFIIISNTSDHIERLAPLKPHGIFLEGEHGNVDPSNLSNYTRACDIIGATPIVRINQNDQGVIYRTLDLGALGIVVPHVNNKEEAETFASNDPYNIAGLFESVEISPFRRAIPKA